MLDQIRSAVTDKRGRIYGPDDLIKWLLIVLLGGAAAVIGITAVFSLIPWLPFTIGALVILILVYLKYGQEIRTGLKGVVPGEVAQRARTGAGEQPTVRARAGTVRRPPGRDRQIE